MYFSLCLTTALTLSTINTRGNSFFIDIPSFVPESSISFVSYIIQIISVCLAWILQPLQFSLLPLI
jgi:hypothetical protein